MTVQMLSYQGKKVFVGIDVHLKQYTVTCRCEQQVVKRCTLPGSPRVLGNFINRFFAGAEVHTAYEAGFSGFRLHRALIRAGIDNIVIHAAAVEVSKKRIKTDKRDSLKIAEQLEGGRLKGIRVPTEAEEHQRLLTRTRSLLVRERSRMRNRIKMRLHQFGLLGSAEQGVLTLRRAKKGMRAEGSQELKASIGAFLAVMERVEDEIAKLDEIIKRRNRRDPLVLVYRQIPGFGPLAARMLADELGDLSQFSNEKQLYSFTGFTPTENTSDDSRRLGHMTRQGAGRLRHVLIQAAWVAIRRDPQLREVYQRISHRAGCKRAIVGVARRLLGRARALFRKNEHYQIQVKQTA